jgi:uncharacterized protein (TIGR03435 family)
MRSILISAGLVFAAVAAASPKFETVSLVPSRAARERYSFQLRTKPGPVQLTMRNVSLAFCIEQAYAVKDYQVSGPGWLKKARYDIVATLPRGTDAEDVWPALQALLADRFQVAIQRDRKDLKIYALTVAGKGEKLRRAGQSKPQSVSADSDSSIRLDHVPLSKLCDALTRKTNRPVLDATGLDGVFDIDLHYAAGDTPGPSLFRAVESQLGLKLEPKKGPVDILIVEHAVRASD